MDKARIDRINELYKKSKLNKLTQDEIQEQQRLRREYIDAFKKSLKNTLGSIKNE